jgi:pimeloyl-ACP methyl ester carboxylesterase
METIEVAGLRIAFERAGDGPPLVLLHGLPGDSRLWRRQLDDLADEYTVVAWDAPGCGRSSAPSGDFGTREVARYLIGFMQALGLEQPHVLGLSWGGGLALQLYRRAPTVPRTLLLASAYAGWAGSLPADAVAQRLDAYVRAAGMPGEEAMRGWAPGFFSGTVPVEIVDEVVAIVSEFDPRVLSTLARSFAETDLRDMLPTIDIPTLLLYGDADTRAPLQVAEGLRVAIRGSRLVVLSGVGHVSNIEDAERFNAEVRKFLRSHDR